MRDIIDRARCGNIEITLNHNPDSNRYFVQQRDTKRRDEQPTNTPFCYGRVGDPTKEEQGISATDEFRRQVKLGAVGLSMSRFTPRK